MLEEDGLEKFEVVDGGKNKSPVRRARANYFRPSEEFPSFSPGFSRHPVTPDNPAPDCLLNCLLWDNT